VPIVFNGSAAICQHAAQTDREVSTMQVQTQFSIFLINKPGVLAQVTAALAKARVNMSAMALMDAGEHGTLRIVCDDAERTRQVLGKAHDRWTESEVLMVELDNTPGAFAAVVQKLASEHVNITYAYCTSGAYGGKTNAAFKLADIKKGQKVLKAALERRQTKATPVNAPKTRRGK
jgi:hypothetical protein